MTLWLRLSASCGAPFSIDQRVRLDQQTEYTTRIALPLLLTLMVVTLDMPPTIKINSTHLHCHGRTAPLPAHALNADHRLPARRIQNCLHRPQLRVRACVVAVSLSPSPSPSLSRRHGCSPDAHHPPPFSDHISELNNARPKQPFFFLKPPSAILLPGEGPVLRPRGTILHYEVELALVMGRRVKDLDQADEQGAIDAVECMCFFFFLSRWFCNNVCNVCLLTCSQATPSPST